MEKFFAVFGHGHGHGHVYGSTLNSGTGPSPERTERTTEARFPAASGGGPERFSPKNPVITDAHTWP
jgi:hypothetical protein